MKDENIVTLKKGIESAKRGKRLMAQLHLREATTRIPDHWAGWFWLAWVLDTPSESLECLERARKCAPDNDDVRFAFAWVQRLTQFNLDTVSATSMRSAPKSSSQQAAETARQRLRDSSPAPKATQPTNRDDTLEKKAPASAPTESPPHAVSDQHVQTDVMVVDDSPTARMALRNFLKKVKMHSVAAANGKEAMALLASVRPKLILLDITMPEMDGYELCRRIKQCDQSKDIPVVMLSANEGYFDKTRGKMVGCEDYLTKPVNVNVLLSKLRQYMPAQMASAASE